MCGEFLVCSVNVQESPWTAVFAGNTVIYSICKSREQVEECIKVTTQDEQWGNKVREIRLR